VWVLSIAALLYLLAVCTISIFQRINMKLMARPSNAVSLDFESDDGSVHNVEFTHAEPSATVTSHLYGVYYIKERRVAGRLEHGVLTVSTNQLPIPSLPPLTYTEIRFWACYLKPTNGVDQMYTYPPDNERSNVIPIGAITADKPSEYQLPSGEFSFDLPPEATSKRIWLCAGIYDFKQHAYMPVR
jgi:hypothetical protein